MSLLVSMVSIESGYIQLAYAQICSGHAFILLLFLAGGVNAPYGWERQCNTDTGISFLSLKNIPDCWGVDCSENDMEVINQFYEDRANADYTSEGRDCTIEFVDATATSTDPEAATGTPVQCKVEVDALTSCFSSFAAAAECDSCYYNGVEAYAEQVFTCVEAGTIICEVIAACTSCEICAAEYIAFCECRQNDGNIDDGGSDFCSLDCLTPDLTLPPVLPSDSPSTPVPAASSAVPTTELPIQAMPPPNLTTDPPRPPTPAPVQPTNLPTHIPTATPITPMPTGLPTAAPISPTSLPTSFPTVAPMGSPTVTPVLPTNPPVPGDDVSGSSMTAPSSLRSSSNTVTGAITSGAVKAGGAGWAMTILGAVAGLTGLILIA